MKPSTLILSLLTSILCVACSTTKSPSSANAPSAPNTPSVPVAASTSASDPNVTRTVKSRDGSYSGEVSGKPVAGSKFAKMQIGMQMGEVQELMGRAPDRMHSYESGKRWIPFYFGNDARRMQVLYKGHGCLIFTGGNAWGGGGGDLIGIAHDAAGACYQE
jgi:hypothetical protein